MKIVQSPFSNAGYTSAINQQKMDKILKFREHFQANIVGQGTNLPKLDKFILEATSLEANDKPNFIHLAGPDSSGTLARIIADSLGKPVYTYEMSAYNDPQSSTQELFGWCRGYKEARDGDLSKHSGQYNTLILKDIDKTHPLVVNQLFQLLTTGTVRDAYREEPISFATSTIILLSSKDAFKDIYESPTSISRISSERIYESLINQKSNTMDKNSLPVYSNGMASLLANKTVLLDKLSVENKATIIKKHLTNKISQLRCDGITLNINISDFVRFILAKSGKNASLKTILLELESSISDLLLKSCKAFTNFDTINIHFDFSQTDDAFIINSINAVKPRILVSDTTIAHKIDTDFETICYSSSLDEHQLKYMDISGAIIDANNANMFPTLKKLSIPVYIYTSKKDINISTFIEQGASDVCSETKLDMLSLWIQEKVQNISLNMFIHELFRRQRVISEYNIMPIYKKNTHSVDIIVNDFHSQICLPEKSEQLFTREYPSISLSDDIVGLEHIKNEVVEFIKALKNYRTLLRKHLTIPSSAILSGPPGCGKTMLAKGIAAEANLPFISCNATKFKQGVVGQGPEMLREIYNSAKSVAPAIIFIDEAEILFQQRENADSGSHDLCNTLLTLMDGFETDHNAPVFWIFSTNANISCIDSAFLDRCHVRLHIGLANKTDRIAFLKKHFKNQFEMDDTTILNIASRSCGWSLRDIGHVVEKTKRKYMLQDKSSSKTVERIFEEEFEAHANGARNSIQSEKELSRTCLHEAAHAVIALTNDLPLVHLSCVSRDIFSGYAALGENENIKITSKQMLLAQVRMAFAGRIAEEIEFEDGTNIGATSDLSQASKLARDAVIKYGFTDSLSVFDENNIPDFVYSKIEHLLQEQYAIARQEVLAHWDSIKKVAYQLRLNEHLNATQVRTILEEKNI